LGIVFQHGELYLQLNGICKQTEKLNIMTIAKSFTLGLIVFLICITTYGQTNKFDLGIDVGPSIISLRGNDIIKVFHKPTIGFSSGLSFQYNFKKIFSIRTNIAFERKGSVLTMPLTDLNGNSTGNVTIHTNFDYLTLPILFRATIGKKVHYYINAGPFLGYLIKQTFVSRGDSTPNTTSDNTFLSKRYDVGLSTGLGVLVPIKQKFAIAFEARNNLGLNNLSTVQVVNNGSIKTNSINFHFCFAYRFGQRNEK
jgi:hypothetical protein